MALETTTYISGLVASNPTATDSVSEADDHIRLIKSTIKATFPNFTGAAVTLTEANINALSSVAATQTTQGASLIPSGGIIMWSGASVPSGFVICDGQNGTPDLRDKFIMSSGTSNTTGSTGGSDTINGTTGSAGDTTTGSTTLTISQIPSHTHTTEDRYNDHETVGKLGNQGAANDQVFLHRTVTSSSTGGGQGHTHTLNAHTHSTTHDNRPAFFTLAFIMKT